MTDIAGQSTQPARYLGIAGIRAAAAPALGLIAGCVLFSAFLVSQGKSPAQFFHLVWQAGFSTAFSWQNTLTRTAPLLLAALCVAVPARLGLMVIGGEGAIVLGGLATAAAGVAMTDLPATVAVPLMAAAAMAVGGVWIGLVGGLRVWRGVNETIASLLMAYIAIALFNHLVEGPLRDPASLNKPSTLPLPTAFRVGTIPILNAHWGIVAGIAACASCWFLLERTTIGFAARVTGGNIRAARVQGLPVGWLITGFTALGGALAGLAGFFEITAIHGAANGALIAGAGYGGILVAFLARHDPLAIVPVAMLMGGFEAASGLVQRRMDLPDATMAVFQGCVFVCVLMADALPTAPRGKA